MSKQNIRVIDTTFYSDGFPLESMDQLLTRTNYLSQIEDGIQSGEKIIFLEGEEDSGKTTLAAQFVKKHVNSTISVFFNPLNNLDYEIDYFCTNAVLQISHLLKEQLTEENSKLISTEKYRQSLYQLRKFLRKKRDIINLVIDGLENEVKEKPEFIRNLFSILPLGEEHFRFIISGNKSDFLLAYNKLKREDSKQIFITGFSDAETIQYLGVTKSIQNSIKDLYKVTKGYPGRLKTLKRLIQRDGYSLEQISSNTTYNTWLELDCASIDLNIPKNNVIISLLSLTDYSFSREDIARICLLNVDEVDDIALKSPIIDSSEKLIRITSTAHRRYLSNILRGNKEKINDLLIAYYADNTSLNSLIDLPKLYSDKKEWGKVINLLDEQYFNKILEQTGSLKTVSETLKLGVQASENSNSHSDLLRYSIQGSIVNELDNYLFWESEIEARISIQDFIGAISLAESAIVLVDRLKLLALIARRQKEFNNNVDEVLINLIQELYNTIDLTNVGEKIYDIVAHLIYALPNLAIEMIERSSGSVSDKNINDWVVAKLSIAAIDSSLKEEEKMGSSKKLEAIQNLNNPSVKKINRAISFLVGNYSSAKVLDEVQKIPDSEEKLKLLRLWLSNNRSNYEKVETVIDVALNELIASSSETSITVEVLNELSSQLPFVRDNSIRKQLYNRFKSIESDLSDLGLAKNKYIYQLNIFHTEFYIDREESTRSINNMINEIESLDDILIKIDSFSEIFSKLSIINNPKFQQKINFVYKRILELSDSLFETTASQFTISQHFLRTIGKQNPRFALKIIKK
jgi:archaellum biogenesis ATPase FlaH